MEGGMIILLLWGLLSYGAGSGLEGRWDYEAKILRGVEYPRRPTDTIWLRWEFSAEGQSLLSWGDELLDDHCARRAKFTAVGGILEERVIWVDPENSFSCSYDPDMQLGRVTRTPFFFRAEKLVLRLQLGEEEILYVWKKNLPEDP
jgi:hypothetical protein